MLKNPTGATKTKCPQCSSQNIVKERFEVRNSSTQAYCCHDCHEYFITVSRTTERLFVLARWAKVSLVLLAACGATQVVRTQKTSLNPGLMSIATPRIPQLDHPFLPEFNQPMQPLPPNGTVSKHWHPSAQEVLAPLTIHTQGNRHFLLKVMDWRSNKPVASVFIGAGQSVSLKVPLGTYRIRYATGSNWYGERSLFGSNTAYSEANAQFEFKTNGSEVLGHILYLYPQISGNLSSKPIERNQF